ncbi:MAG TPA: polyprenyl synthetase family protein [Clostridia bacterium]
MVVFWDGFEKDLRDFEKYLKQYFDEHFEDGEFKKVVGYSLIDIGGKRVRPLLLIKTALSAGANCQSIYNLAVALECIHTYSLIHDDLPSMDNDTYRRGFLSVHAKYGEALAVLSGDALLNFAYEVLFDAALDNQSRKAAKIIADFAGHKGMIKGQVLDLSLVKSQYQDEKEYIFQVHLNKTAALIRAAVNAGAIIANVDEKELSKLDEFACNMGMCFQVYDDISDYQTDQNKYTYPKVFGLENSLKEAQKYKEKSKKALDGLENKYPHLLQMISKFGPEMF